MLYWKLPPTLQTVSTWKNTLTTDETITAVDERDGKLYTVAKLKDGKVWMTQNLDLQKENLLAGVTINSDNTDHPASDFVLPDSQTSGNTSWYDSTSEETKESSTNTAHVFSPSGQSGYTATQLGNYYNWYSATAGTGTYSLGSGQVATGSICPAGWRLPTGATSRSTATDWSTLLKEYGVIKSATGNPAIDQEKLSAAFESPISLVRAGYYYDDVGGVDAFGGLWSSMAGSNNNARSFSFGGTYVSPWDGYKYIGYSVRCVAE